MPITLNGSTSGQVTIDAPAVAGTTALTLPSSSGTLARTADIPAGYTDADALSLFNASGSAPVYACRAWVRFNGNSGSGAIDNSGNVSSVTDNGVGTYRVNFTTNMPVATYCVAGQASNNNETYPSNYSSATTLAVANTPSVSSVEVVSVYAYSPAVRDADNVTVCIFC